MRLCVYDDALWYSCNWSIYGTNQHNVVDFSHEIRKHLKKAIKISKVLTLKAMYTAVNPEADVAYWK